MRGYTDIWEYSELRRGNIWEYSERNNTTTSTTFTSSDPSPMPPICGRVRRRTSREWTGTKGSGAVVQKVPCEGTDAANMGGRGRKMRRKHGGISAAKFSSKVRAVQVQGGGYRICIYM